MRVLLALLLVSAPALSQTVPAFQWIEKIGSGQDFFTGMGTDTLGNSYIVGSTVSPNFPVKSPVQATLASAAARDVFVTKLDPAGNVVYSTCFGGTRDDAASAMVVDALGNVYVTGLTSSSDFPVTRGAFQSTPPLPGPGGQRVSSFLFKLNSDGTVAYSTYFSSSETTPIAIAVDGAGSAYITGSTFGGLPVTPGAYQPVCNCGVTSNFFFSVISSDGFVARFDATASKLIYATYLGVAASIGMTNGTSLAVAPDGSAYVGASSGVYRLSATGSALLGHGLPKVSVQAMALLADGSLYLAGGALNGPDGFQPTPGAAQANPNILPALHYQPVVGSQTAIVRMDGQLQKTLAATWFGGPYSTALLSLAADAAGNLFVGGSTAPHGLPTVTPLAGGFGFPGTGFAAKLSGDLSAILFSSYFGDTENFHVQSVAVGAGGSLLLGGATAGPNANSPASVWVNTLNLAPPPALRIDSVANAASGLDDPVSGGETIMVRGAGFGSDSLLLIDGLAVDKIAVSESRITALVPAKLPDAAVTVQVQSGGSRSNSVLVPVTGASPGLFSVDGTGTGQGYILNQDGKLNSPDNPAQPGDRITIFATGVGPVSFDRGYAVTATPVTVNVDIFYARGVAAIMEPVDGFPGEVYQLTVYVPSLAELVATNPDLKNFKFSPQVGVVLKIAGRSSQNGLAISIAQ